MYPKTRKKFIIIIIAVIIDTITIFNVAVWSNDLNTSFWISKTCTIIVWRLTGIDSIL